MAHASGAKLWLENYGHWGFPGEFLQYGGQSDMVGGEFWMNKPLGDIETQAVNVRYKQGHSDQILAALHDLKFMRALDCVDSVDATIGEGYDLSL